MLKYLDFLSPPITFYYKGFLSHSSYISIILSIFSFVIIIILAVNFSLDIIRRRNPTAFYFNRFIEDAGTFPFNASSFFHFLSMSQNTSNHKDGGINFNSYRIIGLDMFYDNYVKDRNLTKYNHWLYGLCNNESDTEGIGHLINYDFFKKSACIRKFYNNKTHKYYDTDDPDFKWPIMAHGTFHVDEIFYTIVIERCKNDTLNLILGEGNHQCKNDLEMDAIFSTIGATHLYYIDHYIDVLNYNNPNTKFFYNIENGLYKDYCSVNNINIYPSSIRTDNGLILESSKEELTYIVDRNDAFTYENNNNEIYTVYYFWLKNKIHYYNRTYKRIQDVSSSIGGIYQIITVIAMFINRFFNSYIVLSDTESMLYSLIYSEKKNINKKQKIKFEVDNLPKKKDDCIKIILNNNKTQVSDKTKPKVIKIKDKMVYHKTEIQTIKNNKKSIIQDYEEQIDQSNECFKKALNIENNKNNNISKRKFKNTNCFKFILYKLSCENRKSIFKIFKNFRKKIISEEHIIRNHLNIYNLLRSTEKRSNFRRYSYKLKDLFELV